MDFESQVKHLAYDASLKIAESDGNHALLKFNMGNGRVQPVWIIPYDDVWEFSCPSIIAFERLDDFPQWLLCIVMTQNSKSKRTFWCIEGVGSKHVLSAMLNFPVSAITAAEFDRICRALVTEVDALEEAFRKAIGG
jgi:hypothetical protein